MGERLFSNQGLFPAEDLFRAAHPRGPEYLEQAPILVMWAHPWCISGYDATTFAKVWLHAHCDDGIGLKEFLRRAGFAAPMRAIKAGAILPSHAGVYRMLARISPDVLGQIIPATAKDQRRWFKNLHVWTERMGRKHCVKDIEPLFLWAARRFAEIDPTKEQLHDLIDFQVAATAFNPEWGMKRALEEMDNWHRQITLASQLRNMPFSADQIIDQGDHPNSLSVDPFTITALRTPRAIAAEGSAMRHCVATYIQRVFQGNSHIVSITEGDRRVATLELAGPKLGKATRWRVNQLRGPRNALARPSVQALADFYSELLRSRTPTPPAKEPG